MPRLMYSMQDAGCGMEFDPRLSKESDKNI